MKFDKETFSRHRFWFSLGGFVLLWAVALFTVKATAGPKIKEVKKKNNDDPNAALDTGSKDPKNDTFWKPWDEFTDFLKSRIAVVHGNAWKLQDQRITFPGSRRQPLDKWWAEADKFDDWFKRINEGPGSDAARDEYRNELYRKQFDDLYRQIGGPKDEKDINLGKMLYPVEFKGGTEGFKTMMAPTSGSGGGGGGIGRGERGMGRPMGPGGRGEGGPAGGRGIDGVFTRRPTPDEIWYAQEDFWIKSEMLYTVRRTLAAVGKMTREEPGFWANLGEQAQHPDRLFTPYTPIEGKPETGRHYVPEAESRFRNINWQLHLAFEEDSSGKIFVSGHSTLRNVHPSHRVQSGTGTGPTKDLKQTKAPLEFRLSQRKTYYRLNDRGVKALRAAGVPDQVLTKLEPVREKDQYNARGPLLEALKKALSADELMQYQSLVLSNMKVEDTPQNWTLEVKTQDLAWNSAAEFAQLPDIDTRGFDPKQPFEVEQIFDWGTAPIRRIDNILTCYHSHRDAHVPLKPHPVLGKPPEDASADPNAAAAAPGAPAAPGPGAPPAPGDMGMGAGAPQLAQATEANGLERNRYLNATKTCRDVPFAVVVVLEQQHLHDFLVQLANSHLRVQITQAPFSRIRDVGPTLTGDEGGAPPGGDGPPRPREKPGPGPGPGPGRGERGDRGGVQAAQGTADPNLVEVSVYGIAAMYEKFSNQKPEAPKP